MQAQKSMDHVTNRSAWLAAILVLAGGPWILAQPSPQGGEAKSQAMATFANSKLPEAQRLAAAKQMGYPTLDAFPSLLKILQTRTESDAIRAEAARLHRVDDQYIATALQILQDPANGGGTLKATLVDSLSRRARPQPNSKQSQQIVAAFRALVNHEDPNVRLNVARALVPDNDPVAVDAVVKGLKKQGPPPIPTTEAIDLLNDAGAVNHLEALRPFIDDPDPAVQARAVNALALDLDSRPKITQYVRDKSRPPQVRVAALHSLNRAGDAQYMNYATEALSDKSSPPELRAAAVRDTMGYLNYHQVPEQQQIKFAETVEKLDAAPPEIPGVQESPSKLLEHIRQICPAVDKHYQSRENK